jgi:hypothetical protein
VRWKLLKRRLSVSAPRMIVRSHLPWPLRWAVVALALGFSAALALWAFEFGKDLAGLDRQSQQALAHLKGEHAALAADHARAQAIADTAESLLRAERATQERLAQQVRELEADRQRLRTELAFYENFLPATGGPLQMRRVLVESEAPGKVRYQLLLMQPAKDAGEFVGRIEWVLSGERAGQRWQDTPAEAARPLRFRQHARVEGTLSLPDGAVLKTAVVRVIDRQGAVLASRSVEL